eukprot:gene9057-biopygen12182
MDGWMDGWIDGWMDGWMARRGSDRYPGGASGRCQKGPAVAVTYIQGVPDDVSGGPPGSDRYPGGPGR